jgi:hypothetical protein
MVNNKAMALARQKGLSAPGPAERLAATNLTKNFIKSKTGYGAAIVSLMGADEGLYNVDMSYGDARADVMGLGKSGLAGLILLGPIGLIAVLTGLVKTGGGAAAVDPNAEGYGEEGYPEEGAEEGAYEEGSPEEGAYAEGSPEEGGYDESADYGDYSEGWAVPRKLRGLRNRNRKRITVESLARMNPLRRAKVQQAIRSGRLRLG